MFLHEALDRKDVFPGGILVPQTFGGMANWNPHVHALITDTCWDREGNYYPMPEMDTSDIKGIEKLFAGLVFKMLSEEGMISEELVENMRSWKHSEQFAVGMLVTQNTPRTVPDERFSRIRFLGCTRFRARLEAYANTLRYLFCVIRGRAIPTCFNITLKCSLS